jgi:hypothetical protein
MGGITPHSMRASFSSLVVGSLALAWPAAAMATGRAAGLELSGPPACIDAAAFRGRLSSLPASSVPADPPRSASVHIFQHDAMYTGQLQVVLADGTTTMRQVASEHCSEVTDALELVAALALGLEALPTAVQSVPVAPPDMALPAPFVPPLPVAAVSRSPVVTQRREAEPTRAARWRFIGGLEGALLAGYGPVVEVAPTVVIGAVLDTPDLVAPELTLRGAWSTSGGVTQNGTPTTTITLAQGAVDGCPIRLMLGSGFAFRPCAEVEAGVLTGTASGPGVSGPTQTQPWLALAPLVRVEWYLGKLFLLEANGGPAFPLVRDKFFFEPARTQVYSAPDVGAVVRLGVAVQLP